MPNARPRCRSSGRFHARDQRLHLRGAFDADGRLLAIDADVLCNVGAYSSFPVTCGVEPLMALADLPGPYRVIEYRARARGVASNTCPMAPYRGVSRPVITAAMERLMDCAAARLKLDTLEIRRRDLVTEFPHTSVTGVVHDPGSYRVAMEVAARVVDLAQFRQLLHLDTEIGAAHKGATGGKLDIRGDTDRSPYGWGTFASRSLVIAAGLRPRQPALQSRMLSPGGPNEREPTPRHPWRGKRSSRFV
jgi:carbon-monoxide dehydrogenase large subunit